MTTAAFVGRSTVSINELIRTAWRRAHREADRRSPACTPRQRDELTSDGTSSDTYTARGTSS